MNNDFLYIYMKVETKVNFIYLKVSLFVRYKKKHLLHFTTYFLSKAIYHHATAFRRGIINIENVRPNIC